MGFFSSSPQTTNVNMTNTTTFAPDPYTMQNWQNLTGTVGGIANYLTNNYFPGNLYAQVQPLSQQYWGTAGAQLGNASDVAGNIQNIAAPAAWNLLNGMGQPAALTMPSYNQYSFTPTDIYGGVKAWGQEIFGQTPQVQAAQGPSGSASSYQVPYQQVQAPGGVGMIGGLQNVQSPTLQQYQMGPAQQTATQSFTTPGTAQQYMSPYEQNVINSQLALAQTQEQQQLAQQGAQAAQAGAYGGSRAAVEAANTSLGYQQLAANIGAQGYQNAFQNAQQQFNQQQQLGLQSQMANQQAGLTVGGQNLAANLQTQGLGAQLNMQGQLANQQVGLQSALANQQAQEFGAQQNLQSQLANQQAGINTGLAAQQMGLQGAMFDAGQQNQMSLANQAATMQGLGMQYQGGLNSALQTQSLGLQGQIQGGQLGLQSALGQANAQNALQQSDLNTMMGYANLQNQGLNANIAGLNAMGTAAQSQQGYAQSVTDAQLAGWLMNQQLPMQAWSNLANLYAMSSYQMPYTTTAHQQGTTTTTGGGPSIFGQLMGGLGSLGSFLAKGGRVPSTGKYWSDRYNEFKARGGPAPRRYAWGGILGGLFDQAFDPETYRRLADQAGASLKAEGKDWQDVWNAAQTAAAKPVSQQLGDVASGIGQGLTGAWQNVKQGVTHPFTESGDFWPTAEEAKQRTMDIAQNPPLALGKGIGAAIPAAVSEGLGGALGLEDFGIGAGGASRFDEYKKEGRPGVEPASDPLKRQLTQAEIDALPAAQKAKYLAQQQGQGAGALPLNLPDLTAPGRRAEQALAERQAADQAIAARTDFTTEGKAAPGQPGQARVDNPPAENPADRPVPASYAFNQQKLAQGLGSTSPIRPMTTQDLVSQNPELWNALTPEEQSAINLGASPGSQLSLLGPPSTAEQPAFSLTPPPTYPGAAVAPGGAAQSPLNLSPEGSVVPGKYSGMVPGSRGFGGQKAQMVLKPQFQTGPGAIQGWGQGYQFPESGGLGALSPNDPILAHLQPPNAGGFAPTGSIWDTATGGAPMSENFSGAGGYAESPVASLQRRFQSGMTPVTPVQGIARATQPTGMTELNPLYGGSQRYKSSSGLGAAAPNSGPVYYPVQGSGAANEPITMVPYSQPSSISATGQASFPGWATAPPSPGMPAQAPAPREWLSGTIQNPQTPEDLIRMSTPPPLYKQWTDPRWDVAQENANTLSGVEVPQAAAQPAPTPAAAAAAPRTRRGALPSEGWMEWRRRQSMAAPGMFGPGFARGGLGRFRKAA